MIGLDAMIEAAAKQNGIPVHIARQLVKNESSGNTGALSPKGATGLTQVMPATAKEMGYSEEDMKDPKNQLNAGFGYLKKMVDRYNGDLGKALWAYNAGPGKVDKGVMPAETKAYLAKFSGLDQPVEATPAEDGTTPVNPALYKGWQPANRENASGVISRFLSPSKVDTSQLLTPEQTGGGKAFTGSFSNGSPTESIAQIDSDIKKKDDAATSDKMKAFFTALGNVNIPQGISPNDGPQAHPVGFRELRNPYENPLLNREYKNIYTQPTYQPIQTK